MRLIPTNSYPAKVIFGELSYSSYAMKDTTSTGKLPSIFNIDGTIAVDTLDTTDGVNTFVKYGDDFYYGSGINSGTGNVIWTKLTNVASHSIGYSVKEGEQSTLYFSTPLKLDDKSINEFYIDVVKYAGNGTIKFGFTKNPNTTNYEMEVCQTISSTGTYTIQVPENITSDTYYVCINISDMDAIIKSLSCNKPQKKKFTQNNWAYLFGQYVNRFNEEV